MIKDQGQAGLKQRPQTVMHTGRQKKDGTGSLNVRKAAFGRNTAR